MVYDHKKIERKWQKYWEAKKLYKTPAKPQSAYKKYVLDMFPYPSSAGLHVGHPEGYTATDIYTRYLRMTGHDVLHPMGWDAFGLPAENFAIKQGVHPDQTTKASIKRFREQIQSLGLNYDWEREVNTSSPDYYKWTQWFFLLLYKHGLAYKKLAKANWCESCQTVLANEQVVQGVCERCKNQVIQKDLEQWFFKITDYADRLLDGLKKIDWPEPIKLMQKNWIGKSEGAEIDFSIAQNIKRFVLLHGKGGTPEANFFPWLKQKLEFAGYEVEVPTLPNTSEPNDLEQTDFVLKNCTLDQTTVVVGHSFGGIVALRLLERGVKFGRVILVSTPFTDNFLDGKKRPTVSEAVRRGFDFAKIKKSGADFAALYDIKDHVVPLSNGESFAKNLGFGLNKAVGQDTHFCGTEEPAVLKLCLPAIKVFTTRPDTLFGATYMVIAPEHPIVFDYRSQITNFDEVKKYIDETKKKTELQRTTLEKEKTGVQLKGIETVNPATGEKISVWIADYVLMGYGTGAIMAVPAHDQRDFEFAKKYQLPIRQVICQNYPEPKCPVLDQAYTGLGHLVDSGEFNGLDNETAKKEITKKVSGRLKSQYHLRDWLVSRQRYWGAPIPIIYCGKCGEVPVPEKDLPVKLPTDVDFRPTGESPLARSKKFHNVKCPKCRGEARRESDTTDTFVCSSWYFFRFADPHNKKEFAGKKEIAKWLPVDLYVGGAEHAVLHLLYARFFTKVLKDQGYINFDEPFLKLRNQGMILGEDGQKMSKSRGNVINPDDVVNELGADTLRLYEMFMGPLEDTKPWSTESIRGMRRLVERVWRQGNSSPLRGEDGGGGEVQVLLHKTIKKVTEDIEAMRFNTAISALMILLNKFQEVENISREGWETYLKLLSPFTPHLAEECWEKLGHKKSIFLQSWPKHDAKLVVDAEVSLVVQVNGKVRTRLVVPADISEDAAVKLALADEQVKKYISGEPKKVIFVSGKLLSIVS